MERCFDHRMKNQETRTALIRNIKRLAAAVCGISLLFSQCVIAFAEPSEAEQRLEAQRAMEIQSNQVANWPTGPVVGAESAILMEAETGTILYAKNIHQQQYPASTTKLLTTLIATEQCALDEMVTFSYDAVFGTPRDSSHIAMDVGQAITMEQCLNAILIRSANEVSFAVAEHITGTSNWQVFADMMNERAKELGCLNSHFVNPNGLPDDDHYTTAYDLAMIGRAFFANELLCQITLTRRLEIPASDTLPNAKLELNQMAIIPGGDYAYDYLIGCKTGYTDAARSCLVSAAERDGMTLICVVMHDEAPFQYEDTRALFEYGFGNFEKVNVAQTETKYDIDNTGLFYGGNDIFGSSTPILSLNRDDYIILPRTVSFEDTDSTISYNTANENQAAVITYTYHGVDIGSVRVNFTVTQPQTHMFGTDLREDSPEGDTEATETPIIYVNVIRVLTGMAAVGAIIFFVALISLFLKNYHFSIPGSKKAWRKLGKSRRKRPKRANKFRDFDF